MAPRAFFQRRADGEENSNFVRTISDSLHFFVKDGIMLPRRCFALAFAMTFLAWAPLSVSAKPTPKPAGPGKGFRITLIFPETHDPKGNNELFDDQGGCQQVRALIPMKDGSVITAQATGNGGSPIFINMTGPNGAATATQCNVIVDESVPSGFYNVNLTNVQSALGFKMAPKIFTGIFSSNRVFVGPGNYGLMYVYYGVVK